MALQWNDDSGNGSADYRRAPGGNSPCIVQTPDKYPGKFHTQDKTNEVCDSDEIQNADETPENAQIPVKSPELLQISVKSHEMAESPDKPPYEYQAPALI